MNYRRSSSLLTAVVFALIISLPLLLPGKGLLPVRNFTRNDYSFGTQNWAAAQDSLGRMYFGNQSGLLMFDGQRWGHYYLSNYSSVRSLTLSHPSGRIYVGGSGEFGYFRSDSVSGDIEYVSLLETLPAADRNFTEIWNIYDSGSKVWFQGDYHLFRYDGNATVAFPLEARISTSAMVNGLVYLALHDGRLMQFTGTGTQLVAGSEILSGKKIAALLPGPGGHGLLIATAGDGLFHFDGTHVQPYPTDIDPFLKENQLFSATVSGNTYAFGTVLDGAVIKDFSSGNTMFVNRENGLQNSTVLALHFDRAGNLWTMLDNGIDYAVYQSPVTDLTGRSDECGSGYSSTYWRGKLYLATNRGLYSRAPSTRNVMENREPLTMELKGQVWGLDTIAGTLFVASDTGLFADNGAGHTRIAGIEGAFHVEPLTGAPGKALASTYSGFHLIERIGGVWTDRGALAGYNDIGGDFFLDKKGAVWISHWRKGVFRLTPNESLTAFSRVELFDRHSGLPSDSNNSAFAYGDSIYITSEGEIYQYDFAGRKLRRSTKLNDIFPPRGASHVEALPGDRLIKMSNGIVEIAAPDISGEIHTDSTTFRSLSEHLIAGFEHFSNSPDNEIIVTTIDGFKSLDLSRRSTPRPTPHTFVSQITADGDSLLYMPGNTLLDSRRLEVAYSLNTLRIMFACTDFTSAKAVEFSTMLEDYDEGWSAWTDIASRQYTKLPEGDYLFRIRTRILETGEVTETEFAITVLPPWYRSLAAICIYIVVTLFAGWFGFRMLKRWKERAAQEARERKEDELKEVISRSEQESLVKDHEIAVLKSQQLEHDIKHKSNELGNITMNLIRKNEILVSLAQKISKIQEHPDIQKSESDLKKQLSRLQTQIRENISHDDDWKNFTENFDIVYQDYTRKLLERHPGLSQTDLRICCYIKMGLSSKDIAPLFNISYRSVEMSRYRLRKKMELPRETQLTEYLQSI